MRRTLGTLLLITALVGPLSACGSDDSPGTGAGTVAGDPETTSPEPTTDPASEPSGSTTSEATPGGYEVLGLVSSTAAGGQATEMLTPIGTDAELDAFVSQFRTPELGDEVRAAAATAPEGTEVLAAIVYVGCDVPPGVEVSATDDGWAVSPFKVKDPLPECLAAVTTVAVVAVPA